MYKFSIIVPVFQAQQHLEECIDSVIDQEEHNWELILVDDGSPDKSPLICDTYAERYSQIKVLHEKNEGPLLSRCKGYKAARGKYILSLDADDRLKKNALGKIGKILDQKEVDMLIIGYQKIDNDGQSTSAFCRLPDCIYSGPQKKELLRMLWKKHAFNLVWNKVIRTDFVQKNLFVPEKLERVKAGDDAVIVSPLISQAQKIGTASEILYEYRAVPESISRCFNMQKGTDLILSRTFMFEQLQTADLLSDETIFDFYKVTYQTIAYTLWQCARSSCSKNEKRLFFENMAGQKLYQESLAYSKTVDFSKRKQISLWLFKHRLFQLFILYEKIQGFMKKVVDHIL